MIKYVDAFIAPSRFCRDVHLGRGFDAPIVHLPYFVPGTEGSAFTSGDSADVSSEKPYFLFVGRLERIKGLQTLISLFQRYDRARLLIAGTGTYESQLKQLAEGSSNIRFLGHLPEQQLQGIYRQAVAVIAPSIWLEVFGQIIVESFSQQTPAIVRNLGGMPELIEESEGGIVYDTDEELVAAMDRLLRSPSYRRSLGLNGYEAYQRNWSAQNYMDRYFALIRDIASTRRKTGPQPREKAVNGSE